MRSMWSKRVVRSVLRSLIVAAVMGVAMASTQAAATTYYVRKTGSDSANGRSPANAWRTIGKAASSVNSGDIIYVGAGTYNESVTFTKNGNAAHPIQFIADTTGAATGDAGVVLATNSSDTFKVDKGKYHYFIGFRIIGGSKPVQIEESDGTMFDSCVIGGCTDVAVMIKQCDAILVNCEIYGSSKQGVWLEETADTLISGCVVRNNTEDGIFLKEAEARIHRTRVYANTKVGVYVDDESEADIVNVEVRGNGQHGIRVDPEADATIWHTTIAYNSGDGVNVQSESSVAVHNSISAFNTDDGFDRDGGAFTHTHNLVHGNSSNNFEGTSASTGEITSNPQFVSSTDLRLTSASPARNAGTDGSAVTTVDIENNLRATDGGWDIGGYEFTSATLFTNVSTAVGFNVQTASDADGSGFHWADLDDDGDLDVIITGNQSRALLNVNAGASFFSSSFGGGQVRRQGALLDLDSDGDLDFYGVNVASYDAERWFRNNGSGVFSNAGDGGFGTPTNNEAIAAADIDWDGWCDLVMFSESGNYAVMNQRSDTVVLSGSDAAVYGMHVSGAYGNGDFCSSADVNNDGRTDFFYHYDNGKLFLSEGDGTYIHSNGGISVYTNNAAKVGSAWGDYDNDGDMDLFVPRLANSNASYLWRNDNGAFTNVIAAAGIADTGEHRSACWGDYDNDGRLDLYIVRASGGNILYRNNGSGTFTQVTLGAEITGNNHDAVFVDYDNDGDLDLAITRQGTTNVLLRNETNDTDYLKVRVIGYGGNATNKAAIGTRVELYASNGTTLLARREIGQARGYGGSDAHWLHFGGVNAATAYVLKVYFISGTVALNVTPNSASTTIGGRTINQMITVVEQPQWNLEVLRWEEVEPLQP